VKSVLRVVAEMIVQGHRGKSPRVAKSVIHAGFVHLLKNVTNQEFVQEYSNLISLKMSQVKS
jgi:hypothetical protein